MFSNKHISTIVIATLATLASASSAHAALSQVGPSLDSNSKAEASFLLNHDTGVRNNLHISGDVTVTNTTHITCLIGGKQCPINTGKDVNGNLQQTTFRKGTRVKAVVVTFTVNGVTKTVILEEACSNVLSGVKIVHTKKIAVSKAKSIKFNLVKAASSTSTVCNGSTASASAAALVTKYTIKTKSWSVLLASVATSTSTSSCTMAPSGPVAAANNGSAAAAAGSASGSTGGLTNSGSGDVVTGGSGGAGSGAGASTGSGSGSSTGSGNGAGSGSGGSGGADNSGASGGTGGSTATSGCSSSGGSGGSSGGSTGGSTSGSGGSGGNGGNVDCSNGSNNTCSAVNSPGATVCSTPAPVDHTPVVNCANPAHIYVGGNVPMWCSVSDSDGDSITLNVVGDNHYVHTSGQVIATGDKGCPADGGTCYRISVWGDQVTPNGAASANITATASANGKSATWTGNFPVYASASSSNF